jgi:fatty acid desaturase
MSWFFRYDGPTWVVALVLYSAWAALIWFHETLTWWIVAPVGTYLVAWHFSLQHEAIHSFRSAPKWLRWAVVMPPLGLWLPFPLYQAAHSKHHQNTHLTAPGVDTESFYVRREDWPKLSRLRRSAATLNLTLAGRVLLGPLLRLEKLVIRELTRGDFANLPHWIVHILLVAALFWYISGVAGMAWWKYVLFIAWPAFGLGWIRSFAEHRYGHRPGERTAITESNLFWSVLFLYNNLHAVHHVFPQMPWWRIPAYWRAHRQQILAHNGNLYFKGYGEVARKWLLRPIFEAPHPRW